MEIDVNSLIAKLFLDHLRFTFYLISLWIIQLLQRWMLLEEISGCCASVIPRSPIGLWTTTNPDSVLPSSRMVQPLDHSCQNHFHAASYQLLSPSRFFIPPLQLTVQHQKKKNYSKLFHHSIISISSKNLFIIYSNRYHSAYIPSSVSSPY